MKIAAQILTIFLLTSQFAFADLEVDLERCSVQCSNFCADVIKNAKSLTASAEDNCDQGSGGGAQAKCIKVMVDRGWQPSTAKDTCSAINTESSLNCLSFMLEKGWQPSTAKSTCANVEEGESSCLINIIEKGWQPTTAKDTCSGVNRSQAQCIKDMIDRGYQPSTARSTCL